MIEKITILNFFACYCNFYVFRDITLRAQIFMSVLKLMKRKFPKCSATSAIKEKFHQNISIFLLVVITMYDKAFEVGYFNEARKILFSKGKKALDKIPSTHAVLHQHTLGSESPNITGRQVHLSNTVLGISFTVFVISVISENHLLIQRQYYGGPSSI